MKPAKVNFKTVDEYIDTFPPYIQERLETIRQTIKEAAAGAEEAISYNIPAYKLNGTLVYFAGFKSHIGFYPIPANKFEKELALYKAGKGTARFYHNKPMPLALVKKIVKFRMKENLERAKEKLAAKGKKTKYPAKVK